MMTDEKANTEDQSNLEDQGTEQSSVDTSHKDAVVSSEVTEESEINADATTSETVVETVSNEDVVSSEETQADASETEVAENVVPVLPKKEKKVDTGRRWYSLRVISGKERKIKERIELEIQRSGWTDFITQILVPTEKVYKIRQGKKVISERNILPGYILVEALAKNFTGEMVQAITGMPNVIHFLGRNNPIPMQQSEANRMLGKVDESQDVGESLLEPYIVGETVKIIDGPFNEFVGDIQEINEEKKKLKVIVKIFGRGTEVELNFIQVEKQA